MEENKNDPQYTRYLSFVGAPFVLVVAPICGYFIGSWLDTYFGTYPYLSYGLLILGIISGIREFYKLVKSVGNDDQPDS
jgi:F0F1-type ATP synthase assembly protein I